MASIINTNIASLTAQRNLGATQQAFQTTIARLSSGLRINSAKDDAAGLAISERFTSQIRGTNQAIRNANDGISLAQVAEGALKSSADVLQRIRELAVQSANVSNSAADRAALQAEVAQLTTELDRTALTSEFNGQRLLDGTFGSQQFQVGANAHQTIVAALGSMRTRSYGNNQVMASEGVVHSWQQHAPIGTGAIDLTTYTPPVLPPSPYRTLQDKDGITVAGAEYGDTAGQTAAKFNAVTASTGVQAQAETNAVLQFTMPGNYSLQITSASVTPPPAIFIDLSAGAAALPQAIAQINAQSGSSGVNASLTPDGQRILLTQTSGDDILVNGTASPLVTLGGTLSVRQAASGGPQGGPVQITQSNTGATSGETAWVRGEVFLTSTERFSYNFGLAHNVAWGENGVLGGDATIVGAAGSATVRVEANDTAQRIAERINVATEKTGVTARADTLAHLDFSAPGPYVLSVRSNNDTPLLISFELQDIRSANGISAALDAFNNVTAKTGVYAGLSPDGLSVVLRNESGNDIMLSDTEIINAGSIHIAKADINGHATGPAGVLLGDGVPESAVIAGTVTLDSDKSFVIDQTSVTPYVGILGSSALYDQASTLHPVSDMDISTVEGANDAIKTADAALAHVSGARSRLGALQSRFETAVANLSISTENQSAARSRIQDADFAKETADLARAQILQQAGTAMVAQANQIPQGVLALLNL